jgi:hypothetical protein
MIRVLNFWISSFCFIVSAKTDCWWSSISIILLKEKIRIGIWWK